jgi:hypothetical protein
MLDHKTSSIRGYASTLQQNISRFHSNPNDLLKIWIKIPKMALNPQKPPQKTANSASTTLASTRFQSTTTPETALQSSKIESA